MWVCARDVEGGRLRCALLDSAGEEDLSEEGDEKEHRLGRDSCIRGRARITPLASWNNTRSTHTTNLLRKDRPENNQSSRSQSIHLIYQVLTHKKQHQLTKPPPHSNRIPLLTTPQRHSRPSNRLPSRRRHHKTLLPATALLHTHLQPNTTPHTRPPRRTRTSSLCRPCRRSGCRVLVDVDVA